MESETVQIPNLKRELQQLRQAAAMDTNNKTDNTFQNKTAEMHIRFAKPNGPPDESPTSDPIEADISESECIVSDSDFDLGFSELTNSFSDLKQQGCSPSCRAELLQLKQKISKLSKRLREAERKLHQLSLQLETATVDVTSVISQHPTSSEISAKAEWKCVKQTFI